MFVRSFSVRVLTSKFGEEVAYGEAELYLHDQLRSVKIFVPASCCGCWSVPAQIHI